MAVSPPRATCHVHRVRRVPRGPRGNAGSVHGPGTVGDPVRGRRRFRTRSSSAACAAPPVVSAPATRLPGLPGRPASHRRPLVHRDSRRDALHETCTCLSSLPSFASLPPRLIRVNAAALARSPPPAACVRSPPAGRIATSPRLSLRSSFRRRGSLLRRSSRQRRLHLGCRARAVPPPPPPPRALGAGSRWHCFPPVPPCHDSHRPTIQPNPAPCTPL